MNVIGHAADGENVHLHVLRDARHVSPKVFLTIAWNDFSAILGTENDVNEDVGIGMSHEN